MEQFRKVFLLAIGSPFERIPDICVRNVSVGDRLCQIAVEVWLT